MKNKVLHFINDKDKKPYLQIIKESFGLFIEHEKFPKHYFSRGFYHKDNSFDYRGFMDMDTYFKIMNSKKFKSPAIKSILYNKLSFGIFCNKNNIPTVNIISSNFSQSFYYNKKK